MIEKIDVLAHSCVRIDAAIRMYFDPFMLQEEPHDADVVFLTHDHYDHFSPEDFAKIARADTLIIAPESILSSLLDAGIERESILCMNPGQCMQVKGISVEAVHAYNLGKPFHPRENNWLGYVVEAEGQRIYVAGDTDITEENRRVNCDIACIPVGGTYTMNPAEAACLINEIRPSIAVATHFGAITGDKSDGETFASMVDEGIQVVHKLRYE